VGGVEYQAGLFLNASEPGDPWYATPWLDGTSWDLYNPEDGSKYIFRVRARDGSGFASNWSSPAGTTVDLSPPTVPVLFPEPPFTDGRFGLGQEIEWWESVDAGIGGVEYNFQVSKRPSFEEGHTLNGLTAETRVIHIDLEPNGMYYYRVRAYDALGHYSEWSPVESSFQDSDPPSVPVPVVEPAYTAGTSNTFAWYPALDGGCGVWMYEVQVSSAANFSLGTHLLAPDFYTLNTSVTVTGLADGTTYHCRVRALDRLGHESAWSTINSTQDASGPSAPFLHDLPEYMSPGFITLAWGPAVDHGVGVTHYQVWWDRPGIGGPPVFLIDVIGQSFTLTDLGEGNWTFGVRAVDALGHPGPFAEANTTIDATPPTAPVLSHDGGFSEGTSITLSWSPSTDASGVAGYRLSYHPDGHPEQVRHVETANTQATVPGLEDNVTYLYSVRATDVVGNHADGPWIEVTADDSPPWNVDVYQYPPACFDGTFFVFAWLGTHDVGVGGVEYNIYWDYVHSYDHSIFTRRESGWMTDRSYNVTDLEEREYHAGVLARDAFGHTTSTSVQFTVDLTGPVVSIGSPAEGAVLEGTVLVRTTVEDRSPVSFHVRYRSEGGAEWGSVLGGTPFPGDGEAIVPWETAGLPDGDYVLNVTAVDAAGNVGSTELVVELRKGSLYPTGDEADVDEGEGTGVYLGALALVLSIVALLVALSTRRRAPEGDVGEWEEGGG
jgi:predicted phage tail protein